MEANFRWGSLKKFSFWEEEKTLPETFKKKKSQKRCIVHLSSASIIWKKIFGENSIRKMSSWTHGHDDADDDDDDML